MEIQCLIDRAGVTSVQYNGMRFDFVPNKHGHYTCKVNNPGAVAYFLETFKGTLYREYVEPSPVEPESLQLESPQKEETLKVDDISKLVEDALEKQDTSEFYQLEPTEKEVAIKFYSNLTDKEVIEKHCLDDFGVNLDKRMKAETMKEKVFDLIEKEFGA